MNKTERPAISVLIPTLNAERVLEKCLNSIENQEYPKNKVEIIVADGGSIDKTVEIAKKHRALVLTNPLKTGEAGKAVALRAAKGELVALIDSDNILPSKNWFKLMVEPFEDKEILASEPIEYTYRRKDPYLTRYFALLGMNDPLCLFIGNYDRMSVLTGKWTNLPFATEDRGDYLRIKLDREPIPTIGANGVLFRRTALAMFQKKDYLFDLDLLLRLIRQRKCVYVAKVKTGIVHTFVEGDMQKFFRKQRRRIEDMSFHRATGSREINWEKSFFWRVVFFQLQCLLVFPILWQMIKGVVKKPDWCWLFHPVACYSTLFIYLFGWVKGKFAPREFDRRRWGQ